MSATFQFSARCHASCGPAADACASSTRRKSPSSRSSTVVFAPSSALSSASIASSTDCHHASSSSAATAFSGTCRRARSSSSGSRPRSRSRDSTAVRSCRLVSTSDSAARPARFAMSSRTGRAASCRGVPTTPSGRVERREVGRHRAVGDVDVVDAHRHAGDRPRLGVSLPQRALLLDAAERGVQVGDVHAGAHVLEHEAAQPAAVGARHAGRVPPRGGRGDELAERPVEHGGQEPVERLADVEEEPEEHPELGDGLEGTQPRLRDQGPASLEEPGQLRWRSAASRARARGWPRRTR